MTEKYLMAAAVAALLTLPAQGADPRLLDLLPADTRLVVGVDINSTRLSPFGRFMLDQFEEDADFQKFVDATGFDPRRDLTEVLVASSGVPKNGRGIVVAGGAYDPARISAAAKLKGSVSEIFQGVEILTSPNSRDKNGVALLDGRTAAMGDMESLKALIARRGTRGGIDPRLLSKVQQLSARNDVWFISTMPPRELSGSLPDRQLNDAAKGGAFEAIEETSGGVKFGTIVQFSGEAVTRSDKDAVALADVLRFLAGMAQMNKDKPGAGPLVAVIDQMQLSTEANTMKLSLSIPQIDLEKFMTQKKRRKAA